MRLAGWRVDGYGVLADHRVDGLPSGLSIVHGPNEAGKSTLLDFVRGVLFGFPDRRHKRPLHEPLRGGRHGGALELLDQDGGTWLLERYLGSRSVALTAPDGTPADESELRVLLGGADAEVFRSVFAFGLGELASIDSLERDEVRDLVFSAGVLGAGRSATRAVRSLAERQAQIVRPRQQDAQANRLRKRLDELDAERRRLRAEAGEYPARARVCDELAGEARIARDRTEAIRARAAELERLEGSWPIWVKRSDALRALAGLAPPDAGSAVLVEHGATVTRLAKERSGHEERLGRHANLLGEIVATRRSIENELAALGSGVGLSTVLRSEPGAEQRERAASLAEDEPGLKVLARAADAALAEHRASLTAQLHERDAALSGMRAAPPPQPMLDAAALQLHEMRALVAERDRIAAEQTATEHADRLAQIAAARGRRPIPRQRALAGALIVLGCAVAAAAAVSADDRSRTLPILLGVVAAVLLVLGVSTLLAARADDDTADSDRSAVSGERVDLERLCSRIAELARDLGVAEVPSVAEVDAARQRNDAQLGERRRLDGLEREVEGAAFRVEAAERDLATQRDSIGAARAEVAALAGSLALPNELSAAALVQAIERLDRIRDLDAIRSRLEDTVAPLAREIERFESEVAALLGRLGGGTAHAVHDDGGATAVVALEALEVRLGELLEASATRSTHEQAVADSDSELARMLGGAKDGARLRDELDLGDIVAWQAERTALANDLGTARVDFEDLLRAERDAQRALEELESSSRVAEIELEIATCESELRSAMERFAVLGMARLLLEQTLGRYERERQPAVVARAASLFATVTGGRYVQLVARADPDSGRSHGIEAISSSGARVDSGDLSRGTAEQLYLCLRLALATSFAGGSVALPLVLDDVLVNFDPERASAIAGAIAEVAETHQVLAFTCHPHVVELLRDGTPSARVVELPRSR